jgi:DNA polymerase-1
MKNKYAELLANITNTVQDRETSILIVDGMNTFIRSFAMVNNINNGGNHIGGLIGTLKSIGYAIKILAPTKVIIVFDGVEGTSARKNLYPEYKANRQQKKIINNIIFSSREDELDSINNQMQRLIEYLQCLPVTLLSISGVEADDVIAFLAKKYEENDSTRRIHIMSADQDFLQLTSDKTYIYSPTKKKVYTPSVVKEEYGVSATNFLAQKVLLGDSGDNVPGVPKLGKVKLLKLFPQLVTEDRMSVDDILKTALNNKEKHVLYDSVLGLQHQLHINSKLMDLHNIEFSEENINSINESIKIENTLHKNNFLLMYHSDCLGDSIPNIESWIEVVFRSL